MRRFSMWIIFSIFFLIMMFSLSLAQPVVIGERVEFIPSVPRPGESITMVLHFRVENSPVKIDMSFTEDPSPPGITREPIIGGTRAPGSHIVSFNYKVPNPAPQRICFNFYAHFPETSLRSALLIHNACLGTQLYLVNPGMGLRVTVVRGAPPGAPPSPAIVFEGRRTELDSNPITLGLGERHFPLWANVHIGGFADFFELALVEKSTKAFSGTDGLRGTGDFRIRFFAQPVYPRLRPRLFYDIFYDLTPISSTRASTFPEANLLIKDVCVETRMYALSEGTGQRITLPEGRKVAPTPPGLKPARPGL